MERCRNLLIQSIQLYSTIESIYLDIDKIQLESYQVIDDKCRELALLFEDVNQIDILLSKSLTENNTPSEPLSALLIQRGEILNTVYKQNISLHNKTSNIKSLLQHELNTVHNGHSAIKCYKPMPEGRKGLIAHSC